MTDVEQVALWVGLLSGVVSIVMSIVAIVFAILVDRRSRDVSDQTIRSLQKIESTVERLSNDTRELIKAGWDRLLGNVVAPSVALGPDFSAKEIAAGIAAELRAELAPAQAEAGSTAAKDSGPRRTVEEIIESLEESLSLQLSHTSSDRASSIFERLTQTFPRLSDEARALVFAIVPHHLTRAQYRRLRQGALGEAILELRRAGMLVPVRTEGPDPEPAYYFPPGMTRMISAFVDLVPATPPAIERAVRRELERVGYRPHAEDEP